MINDSKPITIKFQLFFMFGWKPICLFIQVLPTQWLISLDPCFAQVFKMCTYELSLDWCHSKESVLKITIVTIFSKTLFFFDYYFFTSAWFFKTLANNHQTYHLEIDTNDTIIFIHFDYLHVCLWCCVSFLPIVNKLFRSLILEIKHYVTNTPTSYIYKSHESKYILGRYNFF